MRALLSIGLFFVIGPAWGAVYTTRDGGVIVQSAVQRGTWVHQQDQAWSNRLAIERSMLSSGNGAVTVQDKYSGPSPKGGEVIDVHVKRALPWANITKAVAKSLPLISTALAIAEIAQAIRCREAFGNASECDPGAPEQTLTGYCESAAEYEVPGLLCAASRADLALAVQGAHLAYGVPPKKGTCAVNGTSIRCTNPNGNFLNVGTYATSFMQCPPIVVNGVTLVPVKGPDGKCSTNVYEPASEATVATKAETYGDKSKAPLIVGDLSAAGKPVEHPEPVLDPVPDSVQGPRETTNHPDGSTTVKDTRWDFTPGIGRYDWQPVSTTQTYPPGAVIPPPGAVVDGTTTTGSAPKDDPITCGLPTTPPCKIDENGTPVAPVDDSTVKAAGVFAAITSCVATPSSCLPALPDMNWSFALPSACAPIPLSGFAPWVDSVDICPYQPIIHDLMSMLWAAAGLFGAVSIIFRGSE